MRKGVTLLLSTLLAITSIAAVSPSAFAEATGSATLCTEAHSPDLHGVVRHDHLFSSPRGGEDSAGDVGGVFVEDAERP